MMYAKINNGQLVTANTIKTQAGTFNANSESPAIPEGWQLVESGIDAKEIVHGFPALTRRQLRLALLSLGRTATQVNAVVSAIPGLEEQEAARIYWEDTITFHREHQLIADIGSALELTSGQIDVAWMKAAASDD